MNQGIIPTGRPWQLSPSHVHQECQDIHEILLSSDEALAITRRPGIAAVMGSVKSAATGSQQCNLSTLRTYTACRHSAPGRGISGAVNIFKEKVIYMRISFHCRFVNSDHIMTFESLGRRRDSTKHRCAACYCSLTACGINGTVYRSLCFMRPQYVCASLRVRSPTRYQARCPPRGVS
jgi:hypothetical protein